MFQTLRGMLTRRALSVAAFLAGVGVIQAQEAPIAQQPTTLPLVQSLVPAAAQLAAPSAPNTPVLGQPNVPNGAPTLDDKVRIERLEKELQEMRGVQNELQEMKRLLKELQGRPTSNPTSADAPQDGAAFGAKDMRQMVDAYLAEKEAQKKTTAKNDGWYQVGSDPSMSGRWGLNRLNFESPQKDFRAHIGGRFQADSYYIGAPKKYIDSFPNGSFDDNAFFRRIRIECDGQAYENIEWNLEIDLERNTLSEKNQAGAVIANGNYPPTRFDELWVGMKALPFLGTVRIGHVRPPQGLECYTSSRNLTFMERSSGFEAFLQEFDPGIWIFNTALNDRLSWAGTIHRIDPTSKAGEFGKGDIAFTGRIAGLPVYQNDGRCLVHLGASYQYHSNSFNTAANERSVSFSAPPDWRASFFTPTFVNTGTFVSDHISQYGLEALAIYGPFSVQAEFFGVHASDVTFPAIGGKNLGGRNFYSGYVYATYSLTGENRRYDKRLGRIDRFVPNEDFYFVRGEDGFRHGRGAWELAARYDWIDLNDGGIKGGYMNNYTAGLNWYLNPNLKFQWNWTISDRTVGTAAVGGGASGQSGIVHAVGMRVQWEF